MKIRSKDDFKLTGVLMNKEEWSDIVLFTKAACVVLLMVGVKTLSFLTRFFPFSLICQNRSFHYRNKDIRKLMGDVAVASRKAGHEFIVEAGLRDRYFYTIKGYFVRSKKRLNTSLIVKNIEEMLKLPESSVYARPWKENKKRFLIPIEINNKN